jgi:hypothetical protein
MSKFIITAGVIILVFLSAAQLRDSNNFYDQSRRDYAEASCALASQSPTMSHLNSCHQAEAETHTEFICDPQGLNCHLEEQ